MNNPNTKTNMAKSTSNNLERNIMVVSIYNFYTIPVMFLTVLILFYSGE